MPLCSIAALGGYILLMGILTALILWVFDILRLDVEVK